MGILNVTPDSFSDGGRFVKRDDAMRHVEKMIQDGVDIIDVGGESTRPGAESVSAVEELERVVPVIEAIRSMTNLPISVDTSTAAVMTAAAVAGASMVNDVRALRREGALEAASATGLPVCLMHMQGDPQTMQMSPGYNDLMVDIRRFFTGRIEVCVKAGIPQEKIVLDPGFGFGKTTQHNLQLINQLDTFAELGCPLLVGLSRKSTIGRVMDSKGLESKGFESIEEDRLIGSLVGAVWAYMRGASILRVHDVAETRAALLMASAFATNGDQFD